MKNYVVESYENYNEENRLSTNNARRIEYLTTIRVLDELITGNKKFSIVLPEQAFMHFILPIWDMTLLQRISLQDMLKL